MDHIKDDLGLNYHEVAVNELWYLERIINEIEEYFEYMKNEGGSKVSNTTTKILEDISDELYKKTQRIRKTTGLPHM